MTCLMPWQHIMLLRKVTSLEYFHESYSDTDILQCYSFLFLLPDSSSSLLRVAERGEERLVTVPGSQDLCQILQDVGDDVYQQYRLTRQGSDFDSQSAFHINVSLCASRANSRVTQKSFFFVVV